MAIVTLRPNATVSNGWGTNYINGTSHHGVQSDNNPSGVGATNFSGLSYSIPITTGTTILDFGTTTLASNQRAESVRLRIWTATQSPGLAYNMTTSIWDGNAYTTAITQNLANQDIQEFASSWFNGTVAGAEWLQGNLDFLAVRYVDNGGPTVGDVFEAFLDVDVRTQPTVTNVTASPSTHRPNISWTYGDVDGGSMGAYQVKVFSSTQYGAGGFNPATSSAWYASPIVFSDLASHQIGTSLPNGTYRAYVIAAKYFRGNLWWSSQTTAGPYVSFTIADTPPAPTAVGPNSNEVVNTDTPILRASVLSNPNYGWSPTVKVQWQIAQDANFSTGVRVITEENTAFRNAGPSTKVVPESSKLFQRTWFMRARAQDSYGVFGPYSSAVTFIVSHPPTTWAHSPTGDQTLSFGDNGQVTFQWTASSQVSFQLVIERLSDGFVILDETKTTAEAGQTTTGNVTTSWTVAIPASYKDTQLRWKIRVTDTDGVTGPFSPYQIFRISDLPVVTITTPTEGGTVNNPSPEVTWTFTATGNRSQRSYQVFYEKNGVVVHSSILSVNTSTTPYANTLTYKPQSAIYSNGDSGRVVVTVTDTAGLSDTDGKNFVVSYTPPAAPSFAVDSSNYNTVGYINVTWTRSPDGSFTNWRIYRRPSGTEVWQLLYETPVAGSGTGAYQDWAAGSGTVYEYSVVQEAERFGIRVESAYNVQTGSGTSTEYWLIHPTDNSKNFHLFHVTDDSFSEEYEFQNVLLLGRGRKTDYGTRVGYLGSLTASLYDVSGGPTARAQRLTLEALKAERTFVYLRNPFGDLWAVTTSGIQITRVAGVGNREFATATIPYQEVLGTNILT